METSTSDVDDPGELELVSATSEDDWTPEEVSGTVELVSMVKVDDSPVGVVLLSETTPELGTSVSLVGTADEDEEPVIGLFSVVEAVLSALELGAVDGSPEDSKSLLVWTGAVVGTVSTYVVLAVCSSVDVNVV